MKLFDFHFFANSLLRLDFIGGQSIMVKLDENSGRVLTRNKINSISKVQHTGIWLGHDFHTGEPYVIHNHYLQGCAHITSYDNYTAGRQAFWKNDACTNSKAKALQIALNHVIAGKPYSWFDYNCQTFTNNACHNQSRSEDVEKWGMILGGIALVAFAAAVAKQA